MVIIMVISNDLRTRCAPHPQERNQEESVLALRDLPGELLMTFPATDLRTAAATRWDKLLLRNVFPTHTHTNTHHLSKHVINQPSLGASSLILVTRPLLFTPWITYSTYLSFYATLFLLKESINEFQYTTTRRNNKKYKLIRNTKHARVYWILKCYAF